MTALKTSRGGRTGETSARDMMNIEVDFFFFNTIFVSSHMYPENPRRDQVIVGSMNMGYISDTVRNRTHNLFRPKREPIPLGHGGTEAEIQLPLKRSSRSQCLFPNPSWLV